MITLLVKRNKKDAGYHKVTRWGLSFSLYKREIGVRFYMRDMYDMKTITILFITKMVLTRMPETDTRFHVL